MRSFIQAPVFLLCLGGIFVMGCRRSDELPRTIVSGNVTYLQKPIEEGEIRFIPMGDTKGYTSAASIRGGHYEVIARGGVPVGTHRVEFYALRDAGKVAGIDYPGVDHEDGLKKQFLPEKFNKQSTRTITIDSDDSEITKDFQLK